ncbi:hypothetical protein HY450_01100 [Candidatus Pacearchaeota archaeon]|nr:hypothetical protein [Candidatus Pacearchaeota archaeon]
MKRRVIQFFVLFLSMVILLAILHFMHFGTFTGFIILSDSGQSDFDLGSYFNTTYNGSSVVLSGSNLSGSYESRIFNGTSEVTWNNLSWAGTEAKVEFLFGVDGAGDVYSSSNLGVSWAQKADNYGRTTDTEEMFADVSYIYIVSNTNREVWRSANLGVNWSVVNNSFADSSVLLGEKDSNEVLYAVDASGDVYSSSNSGTSWTLKGDFNGVATNNGKGLGITSGNVLYVVDGSGAVFSSSNNGVDWTEKNSGYGGTTGTDDLEVDSSGNVYILLNKDVYKSADGGSNWSLINDSFTPYINDGTRMLIDSIDNFFITDATGRIFSSSNSGVSWSEIGDLNGGAGNDPKGLTTFYSATNLTFQARNCTLPSCSDGSFRGPDGTGNTYYDSNNTGLNLSGQYFQYKFFFSSADSSVSPALKSVDIDYSLGASAPVVNLVLPNEGDSYGTNESLALNFSVVGNSLGSCWYSIDKGINNLTLSGCANTTFNVSSDGNYNLSLYANESVLGLIGKDSVNFSVQTGAPIVKLISPLNSSYLSNGSVKFVYNASDLDLSACSLYGNFGGGVINKFILNQTNSSIVSDVESSFTLYLNDRNYLWNIGCNDTQGNFGLAENRSLTIDTINPNLSLTEPSGNKNSRTGIPITFNALDTNIGNCWYNVYRGTTLEIGNTSLNCASGTGTFDVTIDADFVFNIYANDSAGNANKTNSSFTVQSSNPGSGGGGSSGGGGGGGVEITNTNGKLNLEFSDIDEIIVKRGETEKINFLVTNKERSFLNACGLEFAGTAGSWMSNKQEKGLSFEEKFTFEISLLVPENVEPQGYEAQVIIKCEKGSSNKSLNITVYRNAFEPKIINYERRGNEFILTYSLKEYSGRDHEISIEYSLTDFDGISRARGLQEVVLEANGESNNIMKFDLPKDTFGEFNLNMQFVSDLASAVIAQNIFIPSERGGLAGLAISDNTIIKPSTLGLIVLFIVITLISARFLYKHHKNSKKKTSIIEGKRKLIELDL